MGKKLNTAEFIEKAKNVHGDRYDYSASNYIERMSKVEIICKTHGSFFQKIKSHIYKGNGCPKCNKTYKWTNLKFIEKAKNVHGDRYDYSASNYTGKDKKVEIICKTHGSFFQTPHCHINNKSGCQECVNLKRRKSDYFFNKAKQIYGNRYDYSETEYKGMRHKIKIICQKHGVFHKTAKAHLLGQGCRKCSGSNGEKLIIRFLKLLEHKYIFQYAINSGSVGNQYLDFYIPKINVAIEYNGRQHYKPVEHFGGFKQFKYQQELDALKREYCEKRNIKLIVIPYWERKNILFILLKEIGRATDFDFSKVSIPTFGYQLNLFDHEIQRTPHKTRTN